MKEVHFVLQGKGGVGKSLVASLAAQYYISSGQSVRCFDTDPVNQTLAGYKALNVQHVPLLDGARIDSGRFDTLIEAILSDSETSVFIVDNGASSFIPMASYLAENSIYSLFEQASIDVVVNMVLTGGQAMMETINGLRAISMQADVKKIVVWENEFFGPIRTSDNRSFTEGKTYKDFGSKFTSIIKLKTQNPDTFGKDFSQMVEMKLTFQEAIQSEKFQFMQKQRLRTIQKQIFEQIA
jgi:hypothetical protein